MNIKRSGILGLTVLMSLLMTVGFCGVSRADETEEPIDGGRTIRVDQDAPKTIESAEIVEFDASFCLFTRWKEDEYDNFFDFQIKPDDEGVLIASEEIQGISAPADEDLLCALQEIIERNDLTALNGIYDVTAGLSPEYSEGGLTVLYASGERLNFTTDNNPYALWAEEVYDVFASWFAEQGDESLYPPKDESPVTYIRIEYRENGLEVEYHGINVLDEMAIDGEKHLLNKRIYDTETYEDISDEYMLFPEDYYEKITEILSRYDMARNYDFSHYNHESGLLDMHDQGYYGMGGMTPADGEEDSEDRFLSIHLEYESGHRINIDTAKESEIEAFMPLFSDLAEYHEVLFNPELADMDEEAADSEQFSLLIYEPEDAAYSYIRCDIYLGDTLFGYFYGCPDEGDTFTHFDLTPDFFEGIEGDFDLSTFRAEIYLAYNEYTGVDALMQAMMGNTGRSELLASLQFSPEYGVNYEYRIVPAEDGYLLEEMK